MPLLLLHGHLGSKAVFRRVMESSAGSLYRMIAVDLPGHGDSDDAIDPERSYTIPGYTDVAVEVLEALDIDHAVILGWAVGGQVALNLMDRFPGTTGVMISGTAPVGRTREAILAGFKSHASPDREERWQARSQASMEPPDGRIDARLDPALHAGDGRVAGRLLAYLNDPSVCDGKRLVESSGVPLAVVNGADDPLVDIDYLTSLAYKKLWSRRCYVIPRTANAPFDEQPEIFNAILKRFLRSMEGRLRAQQSHGSLCFSG